MKRQSLFTKFLVRWLVSGLGLWIAAALLGSERLSVGGSWHTVVIAGLVLALVNMVLKPIVIFLSIPALLLTLGLFMLVVNGLLIMIVDWLYKPFEVSSFWVAVVAGIIVTLVNYLVTQVLEDIREK